MTNNAVKFDLDELLRRAEFLQFHDALLSAVDREDGKCQLALERCKLFVRLPGDELQYDVHPVRVKVQAEGVRAAFVDNGATPLSPRVDVASLFDDSREVDLAHGAKGDEIVLALVGGGEVQVIADAVRVVVTGAESAERKWIGALDDENAREEWLR